jgi:hypothetical protein
MHLKTVWKLGNPLRSWELIENMMGTRWENQKNQKNLSPSPPLFYLGQILFLCTRHYVRHIGDLGFNFCTHHNTSNVKLKSQRNLASYHKGMDGSYYQKECFTSYQNNLLKDLFAPQTRKKRLVVHQRDVLKSEHQTTTNENLCCPPDSLFFSAHRTTPLKNTSTFIHIIVLSHLLHWNLF